MVQEHDNMTMQLIVYVGGHKIFFQVTLNRQVHNFKPGTGTAADDISQGAKSN